MTVPANFRPLLARAVGADEKLRYPLIASPKIDGVRCVVIGGVPTSRALIPLPNRNLASLLPWDELNGLDGELVIGPPNAPDAYNRTTSAVMSHNASLDGLVFYVFDDFSAPSEPYFMRLMSAYDRRHDGKTAMYANIELLASHECNARSEIDRWDDSYTSRGYEGLMLRDPMAAYKFGRTAKKGAELLKLKGWKDSEAVIIKVHPLMRNTNAQERNELGLAKRSTSQANLVPDSLVGSFDVRDVHTGVEFNLGGGPWFTDQNRREAWAARDTLPGQLMKYKFQPSGTKDKPRFPGALGFRSPIDM
jgi:DNA ligase-1